MGERSPSAKRVSATGEYSVERASAGTAGAGFRGPQLPDPAPRADVLPSIHLDVQRTDLTIKVTRPGALASECSAWLRE